MPRVSLRGSRRPVPGPDALQAEKRHAIEFAFDRLDVRSFADLGGVWAVGGGYTFHGLSQPSVTGGWLVDTGVDDELERRAQLEPRLRLVHGDFGDPAVAAQVGSVDAVLLFDVLLHQVSPDWDQVLGLWSAHTRSFVIVNPQLRDADAPLRLMDLTPEQYSTMVPRDHIDVPWDALDEIDPRYGRPARDVHEYWQWGIPDRAMHDTLTGLGFTAVSYVNYGQWRDVPAFDNVQFVYALP